jgi:hypothetical protein
VKKNEVRVGETYTAKVSGQLAGVRIVGTCPYGGWVGINTKTNGEVGRSEALIRTAARLRGTTERR